MKTDHSKKTILLYHPNRYNKPDAHAADHYFEKNVPCNFFVAETWDDFVIKLDLQPDLIAFHCGMFANQAFKISELLNIFKSTLLLKDQKSKIALIINKWTTVDLIDKVKQLNINGIHPTRLHYGLEAANLAWQKLLSEKSYWPEEIINRLPKKDDTPLHVYFDDNAEDYSHGSHWPEALFKVKENINAKFQMSRSWSELSVVLQEHPKNIVFHIDMVRRNNGTIPEFMLMLETMIKYSNIPFRPNIGVAMNSSTHISVIKELQKNRILAMVPCSKTIGDEYTKSAIISMLEDRPYWPKEIISKLPGNDRKPKNKDNTALTNRQQEVFDLIAKRGLSNKQIARTLNIAESTVKLHVSAIMKNYCVRNRTQLALMNKV